MTRGPPVRRCGAQHVEEGVDRARYNRRRATVVRWLSFINVGYGDLTP
jgi:hypothetical protein